jgi:hypothetical protein
MERVRSFDGDALMKDIGRIEALMDVVEMESERVMYLYNVRTNSEINEKWTDYYITDAIIKELEESIAWYKKEIRALKEVVGWTE